MASDNKTVGLSPKAPTAAVAALVAPLVARLIADALDIEVDSETVEGLILAGIAALGALGGAYAAKPGSVVRRGAANRIEGERGAGEIVYIGAVFGIAAFVLVLVILL